MVRIGRDGTIIRGGSSPAPSRPSFTPSNSSRSGSSGGGGKLPTVLGIVCGVGIAILALTIFGSSLILFFIITLAAFAGFYCSWIFDKKVFAYILLGVAAIGYLVFIVELFSGPKAEKAVITTTIATVESDALNLRAGPASSYSIVSTLNKGDTLTVTGDAENGWLPVTYSGNSGYVNTDYVAISTTTTTAKSSSTAVKGKKTYDSGDVYEGDLADGIRHGKGKYTWTDGGVYEGDWVNGKRTGKGKFIFGEGDWKSDVYEGEYLNDLRHGKGKYTFASGTVYEGDFVESKFQGKGKMTWKNGDVYEGEFFNDLRNGRGKYTYASGTIEDGRWKDGVFLGK